MTGHHARVPLEVTDVPEELDYIEKKRFRMIEIFKVEITSKNAA